MESKIEAISPDGLWHFEDGKLFCGDLVVEAFEMDFHERWTFAKFLKKNQLAIAFETGQPWAEFGSYGNRLTLLIFNSD